IDEPAEKGEGDAAYLRVWPTEMVVHAGQVVKMHAESFDAKGRFLREEKPTWSLEGLKGTINEGTFTAGNEESAGLIKASVGSLNGDARARLVHPLPWTEDFEKFQDNGVPQGWVNATAGKFK